MSVKQQTITNLGGGLELRKPDGHHEVQGGRKLSGGMAAARDPEVVSHYVELLEEWCSKIRVYLDDRCIQQRTKYQKTIFFAMPDDVGGEPEWHKATAVRWLPDTSQCLKLFSLVYIPQFRDCPQ